MINGVRILENSLLTITKTSDRAWRERLLSWPWNPWRKCNSWQEPDPNAYKMKVSGVDMFVAHPATAARIRAAVLTRQGP